jgi:hypothetical protein
VIVIRDFALILWCRLIQFRIFYGFLHRFLNGLALRPIEDLLQRSLGVVALVVRSVDARSSVGGREVGSGLFFLFKNSTIPRGVRELDWSDVPLKGAGGGMGSKYQHHRELPRFFGRTTKPQNQNTI